MPLDRAAALSRIQHIKRTDNDLFEVCKAILYEIPDIKAEAKIQIATARAPVDTVIDPDITFGFNIDLRGITLFWSITTTYYYEIRKGDVWATAELVATTPANNIRINPISTGSHNYILRTVDPFGNVSEVDHNLTVIVPEIGAIPMLNLRILDNYVLMRWEKPTSPFDIHNYIVKRNDEVIGTSESLFHTIFEIAEGEYTYSVTPIDIAGNEGQELSETVDLNPPKDYFFDANMMDDLTEENDDRTLTDAIMFDGGILLGAVDETWTEHFSTNESFQDFIDDGFERYIQPTVDSSYRVVFDFGSLHINRFFRVTAQLEQLVAGSFALAFRTSDDLITWSSLYSQRQRFIDSFRYAEIRIDTTTSLNKSIIILRGLSAIVESAVTTDQGQATIPNAGAVVTVNVDFKSIDSIIVNVINSTTLKHSIATMITINPDDPTDRPTFMVTVFDNNGNQTNATVAWLVRGRL